jgi:hypothetical protein
VGQAASVYHGHCQRLYQSRNLEIDGEEGFCALLCYMLFSRRLIVQTVTEIGEHESFATTIAIMLLLQGLFLLDLLQFGYRWIAYNT